MKFLIMIDSYESNSKPRYFGSFESERTAKNALKEKGWKWCSYPCGEKHYLPDPKKDDLRYAMIISDRKIESADLLPLA